MVRNYCSTFSQQKTAQVYELQKCLHLSWRENSFKKRSFLKQLSFGREKASRGQRPRVTQRLHQPQGILQTCISPRTSPELWTWTKTGFRSTSQLQTMLQFHWASKGWADEGTKVQLSTTSHMFLIYMGQSKAFPSQETSHLSIMQFLSSWVH